MPLDLADLMKRYARRGISDWRSRPQDIRKRAQFALKNRIAETEEEANITINANLKNAGDERCLFIPMPNVNHRGIESCFFLPIRIPEADRTAFDLFLFVEDGKCLGFRFEPADAPDTTHGYGHVQMNRAMFRKEISVNEIPDWLPFSYPAFPIRTSNQLQMFLSMTISVHGYAQGMVSVLRDIFKNEPSDVTRYVTALKASVD